MNCVFWLYLDQFMIVFIDDIPVYSKTHVEHEQHLCNNQFFYELMISLDTKEI